MSLTIKNYPIGPLQENTYLIIDNESGHKAIIDPGYFGNLVVNDIMDESSLKYIFLTHAHVDHFSAAEEYLKIYKEAKFVASCNEKYLLNKDWSKDSIQKNIGNTFCPKVDIFVKEGDEISLGDTKLKFIETPGHTEGSMCIIADDNIFSGDTLFRFSVGNTSFETGNWDALQDSILKKLYTLNDDMKVFPGHGPYTTIGDEKRGNPFV